MGILLDTCTFLWWVLGSPKIPEPTKALLVAPANRVFLSAASAWEIAVKHALGRLPLPSPPDEMIPRLRSRHRIEPLPVEETETLHVIKLPALHRDPFDRMLVSQAICRNLVIATPDPVVRAYPCRSLWPT
jgi:PIN domain nuclease of toxin-antitoxin system